MSQVKETGIVVEVDGGRAKIAIQKSEMCSQCGACRFADTNDRMVLTVNNDINAKIGDEVQIDLETSALLSATFIAYAIPLMAMIAGIVIGYWIASFFKAANSDIYAAVAGLAFAILSFVVIRIMEPRLSKNKKYMPNIKRIINRKDESEDSI